MAHQSSLLDHQYNPTESLCTFSNTLFRYIDTHYEPRGTQLLEPEKMKILLAFLSPPEEVHVNRQVSSLYFNTVFLALSIQTVFTARGPSVTPTGLLAYLRHEIMSDPDASGFSSFERVNNAMRLRHPFARSEFPPVAEPKAKELQSYIEASLQSNLKDLGWSAAAVYNEELEALKVRIALEQRGQEAAINLISSRVCASCHRYPCSCYGISSLI
ncbi:hypothetical protein BGZ96_002558 [Linnemannia gamsii]|uniref:DUF7514 domain-containing protein n=1 Tax=Linnemannia gamsii TaxID=64522 RepID=A0ABQ7K8R9_9FUNG|nr:hypothetical protein BGZ96_002558 [Linnemannia gamsii]